MTFETNQTRRPMDGDWVTYEGDRVVLVATAKEMIEGETELYRHFDADGKLLYVGISFSTLARLAQHRNSGWFNRIRRIDIESFATRIEALKAEKIAIRTEAPEYNKAGIEEEPHDCFGTPFQPGQKSAGRVRGARNKLSMAFVEALAEEFRQHGAEAIRIMRIERPTEFIKVIASHTASGI